MSKADKTARKLLGTLGPADTETIARRADLITAAHALLERLGFHEYDIDELLGVADFLSREDD
jgi:hypothetical protein